MSLTPEDRAKVAVGPYSPPWIYEQTVTAIREAEREARETALDDAAEEAAEAVLSVEIERKLLGRQGPELDGYEAAAAEIEARILALKDPEEAAE